jgi:branched-chain amino acid transport system substrate-binding protein
VGKFIRTAGLAALALAVGVTAAAAQQKPTIKLGAILPLSGVIASAGLMFRTGIELGVEDVNAAGGVNGSRIELVPEDDKAAPADSVLVYRKLAGSNAVAAIGPISSSSWENVVPISDRVRLPVMSFTFTFKEGVPHTPYSIGVSPDERTMIPEAMAEFVKLYPTAKRVVIAGDVQQASGAAAIKLFQAEARKHGIQVLDTLEFQSTTTDFSPIAIKIKGHNPDAVLSAALPPGMVNLLRELQGQRLDVPIFNNGMIWPGAFPAIAGPTAGKVHTVGFSTNEKSAKNEKHNSYSERFIAKLTGNSAMPQPPSVGNSVLGYEGVMIIADILRKAGVDGNTPPDKAREAVKDGFAKLKSWQNIYDLRINEERNGYVRAHLLRVDPEKKIWVYAVPESQR